MKLSSVMVQLATLLLVGLHPSLIHGAEIKFVPNDETSPVPGTNPLQFCASPSDYILNIAYVDLVPNPPKTGQTLTIKASGNVTQKIEEGAHAKIAVKLRLNYGGQIPIVTRDADLCELLKNDDDIEQKCPVDKDKDIQITKSVDIPAQVPKGKYVVIIEAYTKDQEKITCMQAEIAF